MAVKPVKTNNGKKGGMLDGLPHSKGGIKAVVVSDDGGERPVELEDNEVIITKPAVLDPEVHTYTGTNKQILSEINVGGGGVEILAKGGELSSGGMSATTRKVKFLNNNNTSHDSQATNLCRLFFQGLNSNTQVKRSLSLATNAKDFDIIFYVPLTSEGKIDFGKIRFRNSTEQAWKDAAKDRKQWPSFIRYFEINSGLNVIAGVGISLFGTTDDFESNFNDSNEPKADQKKHGIQHLNAALKKDEMLANGGELSTLRKRDVEKLSPPSSSFGDDIWMNLIGA